MTVNKRKEKKKGNYILSHSSMYYNTNIKLFSKYNAENTQTMLVIHVWFAPANKSATLQKLYDQQHSF